MVGGGIKGGRAAREGKLLLSLSAPYLHEASSIFPVDLQTPHDFFC